MTDPLNPDLDTVTPVEVVADLSATERELRLERLIKQAGEIVQLALDHHLEGRTLTAQVVLFSGGNDSTVLIHLMRSLDLLTHAAHANTGIGVEATRQFVRDTCAVWNIPLLEKHPPASYRELVIANGFPGPGHHYKMYQRLKERCLRQVRRDFVTDRSQRVLFIAGRRRAESARRSGFRASGKHQVPLHEREDSTIWASPLAMWTKQDLVNYRALHPDVPFNPVTDHLGMSAECLCGSFARPGELDLIRFFYPDLAAEIDQLAQEVAQAGWTEPHCRWGHGTKGKSLRRTGRLCSSCEWQDR